MRAAVQAALLAAVTAVLAQIVLPLGPVPFNLAVLGAFLAGLLLPPAWAAGSMGVYLALALAGLPVLAGMTGGPGTVLGPTGGYVLGYVCIALCTAGGRRCGRQGTAVGMALGLVLCYALGTVWFMAVSGTALGQSLTLCVAPFILPDAGKALAARALAKALERRGMRV